MGAIDTAIKSEIVRLARREARKLTAPLREEIKRLKKRDAERKLEITSLVSSLQQQHAKARLAETTSKAAAGKIEGRLSPRLIRSLRKKLGLSQREFAGMVGVSTITVGMWEAGKMNPRPEMRAKILSFRGLGRREVRKIVDTLFEMSATEEIAKAPKNPSRQPRRAQWKRGPGRRKGKK